MNDPYEIDLEKRLAYLEQTNLFKMMALDLTKELGEFHSSINQIENPEVIFEKCQARARQIIGFEQIAFLRVDENDSDFNLYHCYPESGRDKIEKEIDILIEDGTFSRAVLEKKPVTAYSKDFKHQLLLHIMTTVSRIRGMFVGVLEKKSKHIQEASFELFSILMAHCANTLESFELYHQLRVSNIRLQENINQLSVSESCLKDEILEHEKTETALRTSEKQYRLLAETAKEIIIMTSDNGQVLYSNKSALETSGYSIKTMKTMNINNVIENFDDIMADNYRSYTNIHAARLISKSGEMISLEINIEPISNGDVTTSGVLIVGRDISERLKAEKENKHLEERLWQAQKMESIGLLASGIAHDFNNILSIIVNYTQFSLSILSKTSPVYDHLEKVQTASNRAVHLARKLYTIGRKDDHKKTIINIAYTINETIDLLKSSLGKEINVKTDLENSELPVMAEETRIQQILMNLITNSAQAMMKKGTIVVSAFKTDFPDEKIPASLGLAKKRYIKLSVTDDGPGINTQDLQRIFDPYFSTKKGKKNSGLGLAVVHGIVKNYKGAIDVQTEIGRGTSFHIYFPCSG